MADIDDMPTKQMPTPDDDDRPVQPEQLGKYPVERLLGHGGMGFVYLGHHPDLAIPVAIKVISHDLAGDNASFGQRFLDEARLMARVSHENVVRVFDVGEEGEEKFLVMEYLPGGSTRDLVKAQGALPIEQALGIARSMARALEAADRHGIVHRDIKPDNILLDAEGTAKLADLGLAKSLTAARDSELTTTGIAMGTPHYMPPEQARSAKHVDKRSDIYALGATLFHLVTGETPYQDESAMGIILKHCNAGVPDPRRLRPDLPEAFAVIIRRMMAKEPNERYADATALLAELNAISAEPVRQRASPWWMWPALVALLLGILAILMLGPRLRDGESGGGEVTARSQPGGPVSVGEALIRTDFDGAAALDGWQRIEVTEGWPWNPLPTLDVNETRAGWLTAEPVVSAWFMDYRGPFLYQLVSGDFVVETRVHIEGTEGEQPRASYSVAGPMLREPRPPGPWVAGQEQVAWLALGSRDATFAGWWFEMKSTTNSETPISEQFQPATSGDARLRVVRIGEQIIMLTRQGNGPWVFRRRLQRPEFGEALQVGIAMGSNWFASEASGLGAYNAQAPEGAADLRAQFDYFRVHRLVVDPDFHERLPGATESQLVSRFGDQLELE